MVEAPRDLVVPSPVGHRGPEPDTPPRPGRGALRLPPAVLVARRLRADRAMIAAVLVMTIVATTLVATIPIYNAAVADAGLRASLNRASAVERSVVATARLEASDWSSAVAAMSSAMEPLLRFRADTAALAVSDSYTFPADLADDRSVTALAAVEPVDELLTVTDGAAVPTGPSADGQPVAAALHGEAAAELGVGVGDRIVLDGGNDADVEVAVVSLFTATDPGDPRWIDDATVRDGLVAGQSFVEVGPFVVSAPDLERLDRRVAFEWRTAPDPAAVGTDDLDRLRAAVVASERRVEEDPAGLGARVTTEMGAFLADTSERLLSTSTAISAVLLQLVAAALVGLLLAAGVLASARAGETLLSWSRGASPSQVVASAVVEMAVVAAVATAAGPVIAREVVRLIDRSGVVGVAGLELRPAVVPSAFALAGVVAVVAVAIVAWPVLRTATAHRRTTSDRVAESGAWFQRFGIDVAVMVLAVAALWQMGRSADAAAGDGIDPNLVVAPGLGVLAASLLALRLIRSGAGLAERLAPRGRGLVLATAARNLARHPSRVVRPALLTVIALATAVFAATYASSWEQSRRDQADAAVGFDVRAVPDARAGERLDPAELLTAHRRLAGVDEVAPYDLVQTSVGRQQGVALVAFDVEHLDMVRARDDLLAVDGLPDGLDGDGLDPDGGEVVGMLGSSPDLAGVPLAGEGPELTMTASVVWEPADEDRWAPDEDGAVELAATVIDADGTIQRTEPTIVEPGAGTDVRLRFSGRLGPVAAPLRLLEVLVTAPTAVPARAAEPGAERSSGSPPVPAHRFRIALSSISAGGPAADIDRGWGHDRTELDRAQTQESAVTVDADGEQLELRLDSGVAAAPGEVTTVVGPVVGPPSEPLAALITPELAEVSGLGTGDPMVLRVEGTEVGAVVSGELASLPGAAGEPLGVFVDRSALVAHTWLTDRRSSEPTDVVVATMRDDVSAVRNALVAPPLSSREVTDRWADGEDRSQDPTTIGIVGGLVTGVGAALVIATLGLVLTAVVNVRQRSMEFAILRALGQSRRELRRSLLAEVVPVTIVSSVVGVAAGVALAARALPSLTAAGDGTPSVPEPALVVPWLVVAVAVAVVAGVAIVLPMLVAGALGRASVGQELRIGAPA
ncbi:MAG: ABC transporter permease [Actinomycetota bacterium]|nr:ABC transporter permease [Actinomycetota bacterium]